VRSNQRVVHLVVVTQLDFNPLAEWWKHFGKDDLLVPDGRVAVFLHARFALREEIDKSTRKFQQL
jgi:hypothetical protein